MRLSLRLLFASPVTTGSASSGSLRQAPLALLPPIPLYRRILRAHRKYLDLDSRVFGDQYVKSEFRLHRNVENPVHIIGFLTEWQLYAQKLEGDSWRDDKMDAAKLDKMSGGFHYFSRDCLRLSRELSNCLAEEFALLRLIIVSILEEQINQLYELMRAIQRSGRTDDEIATEQK